MGILVVREYGIKSTGGIQARMYISRGKQHGYDCKGTNVLYITLGIILSTPISLREGKCMGTVDLKSVNYYYCTKARKNHRY